jgi:putative membrane protein
LRRRYFHQGSEMIKNFGDHAANERTFLAWVRTAIAIIAFGFLVERFDLFLAFSIPQSKIAVPREQFGHVAGLVLVGLGIFMIAVSSWRFARTAKEIDSETIFPGTSDRVDLALAALLVVLAGALLFYLYHTLSAQA